MATTVDLLPGYVRLEKWRNRTLIASLAAIALVATGLAMELHRQQLALQTAQANLQVAETVAAQATAAQEAANTARTTRAPIDGTIAWLLSASKTGPERAALLHTVRQYISNNAVITRLDISDGQTVTLGGTVRDPNEYAQFLINFRRAADVNGGTLFAGLPTATGPGGFNNSQNPARPFLAPSPDPAGNPVVIVYPVTMAAQGQLKFPIAVPADPVTGEAAAAPVAAAEEE